MHILVVNAGSGSLKLWVLGSDDAVVVSEDLPAPGGKADEAAVVFTGGVGENAP